MTNKELTDLKLELTRHIEREAQLREDVSELKEDMGCVKRSIFQVKWLVVGDRMLPIFLHQLNIASFQMILHY